MQKPIAQGVSLELDDTDELAVMLDCLRPLKSTYAARAIEDGGYMESFFG